MNRDRIRDLPGSGRRTASEGQFLPSAGASKRGEWDSGEGGPNILPSPHDLTSPGATRAKYAIACAANMVATKYVRKVAASKVLGMNM